MPMRDGPTCGDCPMVVCENRWLRRVLKWRLRWRCAVTGRYVYPENRCGAPTAQLRTVEAHCAAVRAEREAVQG